MTLQTQNPFELGWSEGWKTDAIISISAWADANIVLSTVDSSEPQTNKLHHECADAAAEDYREWGEGYMPYENERPAKRSLDG